MYSRLRVRAREAFGASEKCCSRSSWTALSSVKERAAMARRRFRVARERLRWAAAESMALLRSTMLGRLIQATRASSVVLLWSATFWREASGASRWVRTAATLSGGGSKRGEGSGGLHCGTGIGEGGLGDVVVGMWWSSRPTGRAHVREARSGRARPFRARRVFCKLWPRRGFGGLKFFSKSYFVHSGARPFRARGTVARERYQPESRRARKGSRVGRPRDRLRAAVSARAGPGSGS
jgi:hypothetical protein